MAACYTSAVQNNRNLVSFFYIWCTGYDLNGLAADIYLADDQLISIRVLLDLLNLSDDDFVKVCVKLGKSLYLCA